MHTAQAPPKRTFSATFARVGWVAMAGFAIAFAVILPVAHPQATPETLASQLIGATVGAAFVTFFLHLAHCRVTASASVLIVVQPIRRYVFPWEQVEDVVVGEDGAMRIVLTDQSSIAVSGFGGSLIGAFTGGIRARKARDGIKTVMAQATSHEPALSHFYARYPMGNRADDLGSPYRAVHDWLADGATPRTGVSLIPLTGTDQYSSEVQ